jgi:polyhydroxybutyrate depolymerase
LSRDLRFTLDWQGVVRSALLHLPPHPMDPLPLVVALHGTGGTARLMAKISGFNAVAGRRGFAVAYPQALGTPGSEDPALGAAWNAGPGLGCPGFEGVDDVGFLRALVAKLVVEYGVDARRIYLSGLSNGGRMAARAALEAADVFAAAAVVAGAWSGAGTTPARPVPLLLIHGTADRHIPYDGGRGEKGRAVVNLPTREQFLRLAALMGCEGKPRRTFRGLAFRDAFRHAGADTEVALWTLPGAGHAWPGGRPWSPDADAPDPDFHASEEIWAFCARYSLP